MDLLSKLASVFQKAQARRVTPRSKRKINPSLSTPGYLNRHPGATFLVLGNGPSLGTHCKEIYELIEKHGPIVMGANNISGFIYPDYHAFTNRKRLIQYAHTIDTNKSKVLLSPYLPDWAISEHYVGSYEQIMYVDDNQLPFDMQNGIIMAGCRAVSVLLIGVALVMGGQRVYVAGLDGYSRVLSSEQNTHYYGKEMQIDGTRSVTDFLAIERVMSRFLDEIAQCMEQQGLTPFKIVTPTSYTRHYEDITRYL